MNNEEVYKSCASCKHFKREQLREGLTSDGGEWYCDNKGSFFFGDLKENGDVCTVWEESK